MISEEGESNGKKRRRTCGDKKRKKDATVKTTLSRRVATTGKCLVPSLFRSHHQFGFREKHATTKQIHRLINQITIILENKKYCTCLFLDTEEAFDKVWDEGLLKTIKQHFPKQIFLLLKSYLNNRTYYVKVKDSLPNISEYVSVYHKEAYLVRFFVQTL